MSIDLYVCVFFRNSYLLSNNIMIFNDDVWNIIKLYIFPKHLWTLPENITFSKIMKQLPKITNVSSNNRFILFFNPKYTNISFIKILELLNWYDHTLTHKILIESYISIQNNENNEEHISIHPPPPLII